MAYSRDDCNNSSHPIVDRGHDLFCNVEKSGRNIRLKFRQAFFKNKKGMEMWQLIMIVLAVLLLVFVLAWYFGLKEKLVEMLNAWSKAL
ncbi:MAG: hypothetical protein AABX04_00845 [Nanoarchaeota archaeon]